MRGTKRPDHPLTEASFHNPSDSARSARRTRAFSVDRIDISDNSAVVPSSQPRLRSGGLKIASGVVRLCVACRRSGQAVVARGIGLFPLAAAATALLPQDPA